MCMHQNLSVCLGSPPKKLSSLFQTAALSWHIHLHMAQTFAYANRLCISKLLLEWFQNLYSSLSFFCRQVHGMLPDVPW
jgi:hypothetical protein